MIQDRQLGVAVTGANGFIGSACVRHLAGMPERFRTFALTRAEGPSGPQGDGYRRVGSRDGATEWAQALRGVDCIIDCAARVHVMDEQTADPLAEFRRVNVEGTRRLAEEAVAAGVQRLVYLSSIKVNGEATPPGSPFSCRDQPRPTDPYGASKLEAEQALSRIARATGLQVVIVRPPLVYGPGVGANFHRLAELVARGWPLPFGAIANRRSMIALGNLVDLLTVCLTHPAAPGNTFLVSDGVDVSTGDLVRQMAVAMGRRSRVLAVPPGVLRLAGRLTGHSTQVERLLGSLQIDMGFTCEVLGWHPSITFEEGLRAAICA